MADDARKPGAFRIPEFGRWATISRSKVYDEIKSGRLECRKVGRRSLILIEDAIRWRNALPRE